jgi:flagellar basal-body rod modification protein FlgD
MSSVDSVGSTSTTGSSTTSSINALGKDEFMKLLIAQLQNQDPLNPQDSSAFSAQLAQFSSLEQLTNLNEAITLQNQNYIRLLNTQSVDLIGKEVTAVQAATTEGAEDTTITGEVTAVQFKDNAIYLTVNDQEIAFSDVTSVK